MCVEGGVGWNIYVIYKSQYIILIRNCSSFISLREL